MESPKPGSDSNSLDAILDTSMETDVLLPLKDTRWSRLSHGGSDACSEYGWSYCCSHAHLQLHSSEALAPVTIADWSAANAIMLPRSSYRQPAIPSVLQWNATTDHSPQNATLLSLRSPSWSRLGKGLMTQNGHFVDH